MTTLRKLQQVFQRSPCSHGICRMFSGAVKYSKYGDPPEVLEMTNLELPTELESSDVKIRFLAAPINHADLNMIQGTYALKPKLPAVAGNEGVAEVVQIGSAVKDLSVGNWVIPSRAGQGTWRTHAIFPEGGLIKVDNSLSLEAAATIAVNPCTAYRMLRDFQKLSPGDFVIQNGANSAVGKAVIQIAKSMGLVTVNVVRNRENIEELKRELTSLGADHVIVEEELRNPKLSEIWKLAGEPKLGLNCVGGKSSTDLMRHIAHKGSIVTYGGMSKQPLTVGTGTLIFKDIRVLGYWQSRWVEENLRSPERFEMMSDITDLYLTGKLKPSKCLRVPFQNFKQAVIDSSKPLVIHKQLMVMDM